MAQPPRKTCCGCTGTWAATLLQSSNVAYKNGVSGPFWYAAGATIQILLFGILAIEVRAITFLAGWLSCCAARPARARHLTEHAGAHVAFPAHVLSKWGHPAWTSMGHADCCCSTVCLQVKRKAPTAHTVLEIISECPATGRCMAIHNEMIPCMPEATSVCMHERRLLTGTVHCLQTRAGARLRTSPSSSSAS